MSRRSRARGRQCGRPTTIGGGRISQSTPHARATLETLVGPTTGIPGTGAPRTRGDCFDGPRPCPWVSCRHTLVIDVTGTGGIRITWPQLQVGEVLYSCSMDVVDDYPEGLPLDAVGDLMNISREMVRRIEHEARGKAKEGLKGCR